MLLWILPKSSHNPLRPWAHEYVWPSETHVFSNCRSEVEVMLGPLGCLVFMLLVEVAHHLGNYDFSVDENRFLYLLWLTLFCYLVSSDLLHMSEFYSAAVLSSVTVFVCFYFFLSSSIDFPLSFKHKHNDKPLDELCNLPKVQTSLIMFKSTPNMPTDLTHN